MKVYNSYLEVYKDLYENGKELEIRGNKRKVLYDIIFKVSVDEVISFDNKKISSNYLIDESLWYFSFQDFTKTVGKYSIWKDLNNYGEIWSNYGKIALENKNLFKCLKFLEEDIYSTRSIFYYGNNENMENCLLKLSNDFICSISTSFRIEENKLILTHIMRSNDAIYGFPYDFCFINYIYSLALNILKKSYPDLEKGFIIWNCLNFHVYERHYNLLEKIYEEVKNYIFL